MTIVAAGLGVLMLFLDVLIVNVALPDIQAHFGVGEADLQWVVDTYSLGLAVIVMAGATLVDRFGRRRLYLIAVSMFGLTSAICGLTPSLDILVVARGAQGLAAAVMNVASLALVSAAFPDQRQRVRAIGFWTAIGTMGLALGPTVGGVLTDLVSWRAVFLVNIPVVVSIIGLSLRFVAESRETSTRSSLDPPGQALFVITVGALVYAVIEGQRLGWTSPVILGLFAVFGLALAGFIARELHTPSPMMDLRLFGHRVYRLGIVAIFFCFFSIYGMLLVTTQYLQNVRQFSPLDTGLLLLSLAATEMIMAPVAGRLAARHGPRRPVIAGQLLILTGLVVILAGVSFSVAVMVVGLALAGGGIALIVTPVTGMAMNAVPVDRAGMASGMLNTQRGLGSSIGYAVLGTVLVTWIGGTLNTDLTAAIPNPAQRTAVVQQIIDEANPHAYVAEVGPGRPITAPNPAQESAIRAAADKAFTQGIQLSLGLGATLAALVLLLLLRGFREPGTRRKHR
ncbi:MFS transporter [Micromonospora sp. WMMA1363]|uniref:MFS transporter n=1 Tax=Micromonospora sp. WMMA1363 TaxID=3053985 RepID=UPI00259CFD2B|nr:MFS transporter [Micromonospora sp. WMMA1363]MDM4719900.1 MFS transporter [Micromonospora sp. WMMA1363]